LEGTAVAGQRGREPSAPTARSRRARLSAVLWRTGRLSRRRAATGLGVPRVPDGRPRSAVQEQGQPPEHPPPPPRIRLATSGTKKARGSLPGPHDSVTGHLLAPRTGSGARSLFRPGLLRPCRARRSHLAFHGLHLPWKPTELASARPLTLREDRAQP